jgi:hypothetical protein
MDDWNMNLFSKDLYTVILVYCGNNLDAKRLSNDSVLIPISRSDNIDLSSQLVISGQEDFVFIILIASFEA